MRYDKWFSFALGSLVTFMLSFACAGCLATAFELGRYADMAQIALWCGFISVISCLLQTLRAGWLMPCLLVLLGAVLWHYSELRDSFKALLHTISVYCDRGYDCGILEWKDFRPEKIDRTLALQAISSLVAMFTGWCICEKRGCTWAILAAVIAFAPCTLVLFSVPDEKYLLLWFSTIVLLLLTQNARIQNEHEGNRLTLFLLIPVLSASALLFALLPQETYEGRQRAEQLLAKIQPYLNIGDTKKGNNQISTMIDLQNLEASDGEDRKVMVVSTTEKGIYYLRGHTYDTYTGLAWQQSGEEYDLPWQPCGDYIADVMLETSSVESVLYLPYYTDEMVMSQDVSGLENSSDIKKYTYRCYKSDEKYSISSYSEEAYNALTELPKDTRTWAEAYLQAIYGDQMYFAESIASHVRSSAQYDLSAYCMDGQYSDFAQWFLEEADTGYCVHFATATAVLLRAAGIPARYVTGYSVEIKNSSAYVYQTDAHAWVEYWTAHNGWQILEATPSVHNEYVPATTEKTPQESTGDTLQPTTATEPTEEDATATSENEGKTEPSENPTLPRESSTEENPQSNEKIDISAKNQQEKGTDKRWQIPDFAKWLMLIVLVIAVTVVQWRIRLAKTARRLQTGGNNDRALQYWSQLLRYTSVLDVQPEQNVYRLVSKAKFSQHMLTDEELLYLQEYVQRYVHKLRARPWYKRFWDRIILALY